ncbi:hypothetical protein YC2023_044570 [Brassica napus]
MSKRVTTSSSSISSVPLPLHLFRFPFSPSPFDLICVNHNTLPTFSLSPTTRSQSQLGSSTAAERSRTHRFRRQRASLPPTSLCVYAVIYSALATPDSSVLSGVDHMCLPMYDDQFRFHVHEDFESNCGLRGDLYGVRCGWPHEATELTIAHSPSGSNSILQIHGQCRHFRYPFSDDTEFRTYSWTLALSSISSSHVFIDKYSNPQSTTSIVRLNSNLEFAKKVNA